MHAEHSPASPKAPGRGVALRIRPEGKTIKVPVYIDTRPQRMNAIGQRSPIKCCDDCGADLQWVHSRWRCPWTSPARERGSSEPVLTCKRPFIRTAGDK